jgi:hypothetical protein
MTIPLDTLIEEFYRACYPKDRLKSVHPSPPKEMMVDENDQREWFEWKLVKRSEGIDPQFTAFENEIGCILPESFKQWHSRYYTLDGDLGFIRLPAIPSNDPFGPVRHEMFEMYLPERYREQGFLPFGSDGAWDAGPLCFHTGINDDAADWPIYLWDHDNAKQDPILCFSNFRKLLECSIHDWGGHLLDYGSLAIGSQGFTVIDPEGAGRFYNRA